jgi:hypothetical protein
MLPVVGQYTVGCGIRRTRFCRLPTFFPNRYQLADFGSALNTIEGNDKVVEDITPKDHFIAELG